jgi:hypothetical protein
MKNSTLSRPPNKDSIYLDTCYQNGILDTTYSPEPGQLPFEALGLEIAISWFPWGLALRIFFLSFFILGINYDHGME